MTFDDSSSEASAHVSVAVQEQGDRPLTSPAGDAQALAVPLRTVSLRFLKGFVERHKETRFSFSRFLRSEGGVAQFEDVSDVPFAELSTGEVMQLIVKAETRPLGEDGESFVDSLARRGDLQIAYAPFVGSRHSARPWVGRATLFVSHAWSSKFYRLFRALEALFETNHWGLENVNPDECFAWIDIFAVNQHDTSPMEKLRKQDKERSRAWWKDTFLEAVQTFGATAIVLDPYPQPNAPATVKPVALTRIWCLFEFFCTISGASCELYLAVVPEDEQKMSAWRLPAALKTISLEEADAADPEDKADILSLIRSSTALGSDGFRRIQSTIQDKLRMMLVERHARRLRGTFQAFGKWLSTVTLWVQVAFFIAVPIRLAAGHNERWLLVAMNIAIYAPAFVFLLFAALARLYLNSMQLAVTRACADLRTDYWRLPGGVRDKTKQQKQQALVTQGASTEAVKGSWKGGLAFLTTLVLACPFLIWLTTIVWSPHPTRDDYRHFGTVMGIVDAVIVGGICVCTCCVGCLFCAFGSRSRRVTMTVEAAVANLNPQGKNLDWRFASESLEASAGEASSNVIIESENPIKILLVGNSGAGKSSLLEKLSANLFREEHIPTIGIDFRIVNFELDRGNRVKLQIWDTSGLERFRAIAISYYKSVTGIMVVFDVTDEESFDSIPSRLRDAVECGAGSAVIMLVGTKSDLADSRMVSYEKAMAFAKSVGVPYAETSSKTGDVVEIFKSLVVKIMSKRGR